MVNLVISLLQSQGAPSYLEYKQQSLKWAGGPPTTSVPIRPLCLFTLRATPSSLLLPPGLCLYCSLYSNALLSLTGLVAWPRLYCSVVWKIVPCTKLGVVGSISSWGRGIEFLKAQKPILYI